MRKLNIFFLVIMSLFIISACGAENEAEGDTQEELALLEVEFEPEDTAEIGETVELVATVTYDDEPVTDATEMDFEYWYEDDEEDSEMVESTNNEDGTYSIEVSFDKKGEYWIYAHTTAHDQHTMPKRSIQVSE